MIWALEKKGPNQCSSSQKFGWQPSERSHRSTPTSSDDLLPLLLVIGRRNSSINKIQQSHHRRQTLLPHEFGYPNINLLAETLGQTEAATTDGPMMAKGRTNRAAIQHDPLNHREKSAVNLGKSHISSLTIFYASGWVAGGEGDRHGGTVTI